MFYRAPLSRSRFLLDDFVLISALIGALTCTLTHPIEANSAALGDITVRSALGQRLDAEIDIAALTSAEAESVSVKLAPPELWTSAGIDLGSLQRSLRLSVDKKEGRHRVRITSDLAVNEPFMHLLVELSASGVRTIRQYVLLIDPPVTVTAPSTAANAAPGNTPIDVISNAVKSTETVAPASSSGADTSRPSQSVKLDDGKVAEPSSDQQYRVKRGETLRSIAQQLQPDGVQLEQVMVSLFNRNPDAFVGNNLHRLRSGSLLTLPASEAMSTIEPEKARQTVRIQTADFLRYQRQLAERSASRADTISTPTADPTPKANLQSSGGRVSVRLSEPAAPPAAQDKLTLSAPGGNNVTGSSPSAGTNSKETLEKVASDKALADANARIAALEKNIGDMQALLEMKSHALSEAQQRAERAPLTQSEPVHAPPAISAPKDSSTPTAAPTAAPTVAPTVAPTPTKAPNSSTTTEDVFAFAQVDPIISAGAAAGLLALALLWRRQRRATLGNHERASGPIEPTMSPTVIGEAGGRQIDTAHSVFHSNFVPSISQIDMNEVDAVAEADVYIAYGRDEQAEEILLDALRAHPERHALRVKLLEIYAARNDHQRFGTVAAELRLLTHGQGLDWARASHIGQSFEPDNHLYRLAASSVDAIAPSIPKIQNGSNPPLSHTNENGLLLSKTLAGKGSAREASMSDKLFIEESINQKSINEQVVDDKRISDTSNLIDFSLEPIAPKTLPPTTITAPTTQGPVSSSVLSTKLELALACQEIGDHAGARDLLNEVASARDPELAQRAQALLLQLA